MGVAVVCWNINKRQEPWRELVRMDADVALVQEAFPPAEGDGPLDIGPREAWDSHSWNSDWWQERGWPALYDRWPMVVKLSDRVEVEWFRQISPTRWIDGDEIAVISQGYAALLDSRLIVQLPITRQAKAIVATCQNLPY